MLENDLPFDEFMKPFINLGHEKRNNAMLRQVTMLANSPGTANPMAAGKAGQSMAELVSLYRFVANSNVPIDQLRAIRASAVTSLMPEGELIPIVHDVTLLDYSTHESKHDRRPIGDHEGMGYEYIPALALHPGDGSILGVLHDTLVSEKGPDDTDVMNYDYEPALEKLYATENKRLLENHRHQLAVRIRGLNDLFPERRFAHVADREFDDIFILDANAQNGGASEFVIRCMGNRSVQVPLEPWVPERARNVNQMGHRLPKGWCNVSLEKLVAAIPLLPYKELALDARGRVTGAESAKRVAQLHIGSCRVRLNRPAERNKKRMRTPRPVEVNLVVVRELERPEQGEPLCWLLFSSLPADTFGQMATIAWYYELRWMVEVFFRVLKSGYRIEHSRFDNAEKTARLLVLLSLAAMTVFELKRALSLPLSARLDDEQYAMLKQAVKHVDDEDYPLEQRLLGMIARAGGWLGRRSDPLGYTVLMRGLLQVLAILDAAIAHRDLILKIQENPKILRKFLCV